jgi:hypothetical protein
MRLLGQPGTVRHLAGFLPAEGGPRLVAGRDHDVSIWDPVSGARTAAFDVDCGINDIVVCRADSEGPVLAVATDMGIRWFNAVTGTPCYGSSTDDTVWGWALAAVTARPFSAPATPVRIPFIDGMRRPVRCCRISASMTTTSRRWRC